MPSECRSYFSLSEPLCLSSSRQVSRELSPGALNTCVRREKDKEKSDINRMRNRSRNNCIFSNVPIKRLFISRLIASYDNSGELLLEKNSTTQRPVTHGDRKGAIDRDTI